MSNRDPAVILFGSDGNPLEVTEYGALLVAEREPLAPPDTTAVVELERGDVASNTTIEDVYVITSGKTLYLQQIQAGALALVTGSAKVEWLYRPDPMDTGLDQLIDVVYLNINGGSHMEAIMGAFVGDGTAEIVMRRVNGPGGTREMSAKFVGYEETT
jgi:hypothetical protein